MIFHLLNKWTCREKEQIYGRANCLCAQTAKAAYLHVGSDAPVNQVVGLVKEEMAGSNVLWLI
jgi:hypothetical protein